LKYLLDTNILSQATKPVPDAATIEWLDSVALENLYLSAVTLIEFRQGIELLAAGKNKQTLENWLQKDILGRFRGRILPVDIGVADAAGRISAMSKRGGLNIQVADLLIAATAQTHGMTLVTLNRKHFEKLGVAMVKF
jgi:hypothetical protein